MQILFISEEAQVLNFLSGMQAEAIMPRGNVEISGVAEDSLVTVICSGGSTHYKGTITRIIGGYPPAAGNGKWLDVKFLVRRTNAPHHYDFDRPTPND